MKIGEKMFAVCKKDNSILNIGIGVLAIFESIEQALLCVGINSDIGVRVVEVEIEIKEATEKTTKTPKFSVGEEVIYVPFHNLVQPYRIAEVKMNCETGEFYYRIAFGTGDSLVWRKESDIKKSPLVPVGAPKFHLGQSVLYCPSFAHNPPMIKRQITDRKTDGKHYYYTLTFDNSSKDLWIREDEIRKWDLH